LLLIQLPKERRRFDSPAIAFTQFPIDLCQRVSDRLQQIVERLLTPADFSKGVSLNIAELLVRELQEFVGARPQGGSRDRVERRLELRLRLLEKRQLLGYETVLVRELGSQACIVDTSPL
jgi:hypothetical protein